MSFLKAFEVSHDNCVFGLTDNTSPFIVAHDFEGEVLAEEEPVPPETPALTMPPTTVISPPETIPPVDMASS